MGQIVVGVDESEGAARALRFAVREGELRGWTVTAVMTWGFLAQRHTTGGEQFDPDYGEDDAVEALAVFVERALGDAGGAVGQRAVCDLPARGLLAESADADLLVVGSRGLGGFKGLLLGSVSQQCLHHTTIPIAVVRRDPPAEQHEARVVVAVDGSETARRAVTWGIDEARRRSAGLTVLNAWQLPYVGGYLYTAAAFDRAELERASHQVIANALEGADLSGLPGPAEWVSVGGSPAAAILETAAGADLVVMGSRGLGGFKGLLLGSVTATVAHHAETTIVVIPPEG